MSKDSGSSSRPRSGVAHTSRASLLAVSALGIAAWLTIFAFAVSTGTLVDRLQPVAWLGLGFAFGAGVFALASASRAARPKRRHICGSELNEAARTRSAFLANMSHELRTPLTAIVATLHLAQRTDLSQEQREYLELAALSSRRLLALVDDVLDVAQRTPGSDPPLKEKAFSLQTLVSEAVRSLGPSAEEKRLELVCDVAADVPDGVRGDPSGLQQVLDRLLDNAIRFTERGTVTLEVSRDDGDRLHFRVSDTGVGIAPDARERIFESFTQADESLTRPLDGPGLGLFLSTRIVERMGGRIWVDSELSRGSTFHVAVPLPPDPRGNALFPPVSSALRDIRVLVVEREPAARRVLGAQLRGLGVRPTLMAGARAAHAALHEAAREGAPYGLVILDDTLRGSVVFRSRRPGDDPLVAATPQIVTSSLRARAAANPGPAPRLLKPVTPPALLAALTRLMVGPAEASLRIPPSPAAASTVEPLRVLVAEDNPVNALLLARMVELLGHRVEVVKNGKEALAVLEGDDVDVVLMDVQMPVMDGLQATRQLRERERRSRRRVYVVALTAVSRPGDEAACRAAGMDGWLPKPFDQGQLRDALDRAPEREPQSTVPEPSAQVEQREPTAPLRSFDRDRLIHRLGDDPEAAAEVLSQFLEEGPGLLARIRRDVDAADAAALERSAHRLKGTLLWIAADAAAQTASVLEAMGRTGEVEGAAATLVTLERRFAGVLGEVRRATENPDSSS